MKRKSIINHAAVAKGSDTNPERLYEVLLFRSQWHSCIVTMPAATEQQAKQRASALAKSLVLDWRIFVDDLKVQKATLVKEGQSHD